jgi:hypothetical protein
MLCPFIRVRPGEPRPEPMFRCGDRP